MKMPQVLAVVTGGASGLGLAVARHVVAMGGRVCQLDVQQGPGEKAAGTWAPRLTRGGRDS